MIDFIKDVRKREVQAIGAAISLRDWHKMETTYNMLRDKMDRMITDHTVSARKAGAAPHIQDGTTYFHGIYGDGGSVG